MVFKWCIVHHEFVPRGRSITAAYNNEVLTHLHENSRQRQPQKWKDGWILHHDNALSHTAMAVQQFLAEKKITLMPQPPYSPTLHHVTSGCSLN
jgi:transposase